MKNYNWSSYHYYFREIVRLKNPVPDVTFPLTIISAILTNWDQLVIFMVFDPVNLTIGVKRDHFLILCQNSMKPTQNTIICHTFDIVILLIFTVKDPKKHKNPVSTAQGANLIQLDSFHNSCFSQLFLVINMDKVSDKYNKALIQTETCLNVNF